MAICGVAFVGSGLYIASYYIKSSQSKKQAEVVRDEAYTDEIDEDNLIDYKDEYNIDDGQNAEQKDGTNENASAETGDVDQGENTDVQESESQKEDEKTDAQTSTNSNASSTGKTHTAKITSKKVIDFKSLKKRNQEVSAWVKIPATAIDYPVVYTKKNNTKYLKKNFDGKEDSHGTLFFEKGCVPGVSDSNLLIYGHNMKDGSMFSGLLPYRQKTYLEANSYACMFTEDANYLYKAVVAFQTDVSKKNKKGFFFSDYIDLTSDTTYQDFKKQLKKHQLYEPVEEIKKGDSLMMLSTCEYSTDNGRLVVVFKRVDEKKIKK